MSGSVFFFPFQHFLTLVEFIGVISFSDFWWLKTAMLLKGEIMFNKYSTELEALTSFILRG